MKWCPWGRERGRAGSSALSSPGSGCRRRAAAVWSRTRRGELCSACQGHWGSSQHRFSAEEGQRSQPGHTQPSPPRACTPQTPSSGQHPFLNLKIFVSPFCTPSRTRLFHYFHCCNSTQTASLRSCVQEHGDRQCCTHLRWEGEGHCEGQKSSETPRHHLQHTQHSFLGQW